MNNIADLHFEDVFVQTLHIASASSQKITLQILRLDVLHEIISGNKWFKLKYYLQYAQKNNYKTVATFGGAYSNHIIATAYAAKIFDLKSVGIIRSEKPKKLSHTLKQAELYGMELIFVARELYQKKQLIQQQYNSENWYWIPEGGYGKFGAFGIKDIFQWIKPNTTHIMCAVGTGTMFAGLINHATTNQNVIGINVLKGNESIETEVKGLINHEVQKNYCIHNNYHFGGYAKHTPELINFMIHIWEKHQLPTDFVYTAKLVYGVLDLIEKNHFAKGSKIMVIHSGGLQGNLSLPKHILPF